MLASPTLPRKGADAAINARLDRSLGTAGVLFLTLSITIPASSLFVIVPGSLQIAGTGALLALAIAGVVCLATALIYAELSSAFPVAGGEYVMVGDKRWGRRPIS